MTGSSQQQQLQTKEKCPFSPREGYTTARGLQDYCKLHDNDSDNFILDTSNEYTLTASLDRNEPLYFGNSTPCWETAPSWTCLGSSKQHHIATQAAYWIDSMGGGRRYPGGDYRLSFHHNNNAKEVMTERGAKLWMKYMRASLEAARFDDPRVKPCILDFLNVKMQKYAHEFGWKHDEEDLVLYQD